MKPNGDEIDGSRSQDKPPLGSPRSQAYGQSPNPGNGGTGGGPGIADGEIKSQKLATDDPLTYLKQVKETFQDQRYKYDMFLDVMKDFKAGRIDTTAVIARVKELLKAHNNLILSFNTFLPHGFKIALDDEEEEAMNPNGDEIDGSRSQDKPPLGSPLSILKTLAILVILQFNFVLPSGRNIRDALAYENQVRDTFQDQRHKFDMFLDVMNDFKAGRIGIITVIARVKELFRGHDTLIYGFNTFLPHGFEIAPDDEEEGNSTTTDSEEGNSTTTDSS